MRHTTALGPTVLIATLIIASEANAQELQASAGPDAVVAATDEAAPGYFQRFRFGVQRMMAGLKGELGKVQARLRNLWSGNESGEVIAEGRRQLQEQRREARQQAREARVELTQEEREARVEQRRLAREQRPGNRAEGVRARVNQSENGNNGRQLGHQIGQGHLRARGAGHVNHDHGGAVSVDERPERGLAMRRAQNNARGQQRGRSQGRGAQPQLAQ